MPRGTVDGPSTAPAATVPVKFTLNGRSVVGRSDETLIQTAKHHGIDIPHLCYKEGLRPDGNCRACVVEIKGERVLAPSCCRTPKDGMEVTTDSPRALASQEDEHDRHERKNPLQLDKGCRGHKW